ncbi:MAG: rhomboid family intramembrane serine protease [Candidatus Kapaibacterium sp.]
MFRNLPPVVRYLLAAFVASFVLDLIGGRIALYATALFSNSVYPGFQLWRLVTYPFITSFYSLLRVGLILFFFGSELETIVHSQRLGYALLAAVILGGLIFTFVARDSAMGGPTIVYMFVLAGFTYLWPNRQVSLFGMFMVRTWPIALAMFVFAILPMNGTTLDTSASKLFEPIFGTLFGLAYFHITYRQYKFGANLLAMFKPKATPKSVGDWSEKKTVEAQIDALLDKISRNGMDSLTKDEREFLFKHSKN